MRTLAAALLAVLAGGSVPVEERPNILFFLSDDHRWDALGCAGHPVLKTPHIDRLAAEGVRFRNAFVTTPICAASRASILTGLYERSHKFTFRTPPIAAAHAGASYPALLKAAGYRTGFFGKFGVQVPADRRAAMFDEFADLNRTPYFKKQADGTRRHIDDIIGDRAVEFLKAQPREKPFCLSLSFNAGHAEDNDKAELYPWPPAADGLYEGVEIPRPRLDDPQIFENLPGFLKKSEARVRYFWGYDTPEKYQKNIRAYLRLLSGMDAVVGRVRAEVERLGLGPNTVVIFTGDNGYYMGNRGFQGKWFHHEESLRVPLIVMDPRLPAKRRGIVEERMALNVDLAPTFIALAGSALSATHQGRSLVPLLRGDPPADWRKDFLCEHLFDNPRIPKWEGVREGRWKYARYFQQEPPFEFLHDLESDPDELRNLAGVVEHSESLARLRSRCDALRGVPYSPENFPTLRGK